MARQSGAVAVQRRVWVPLTRGQSPHWPVCPASAPWCVRASVSPAPHGQAECELDEVLGARKTEVRVLSSAM